MSTSLLRQGARQLSRRVPQASRQFSIVTEARSAMQAARREVFEGNSWTKSQPADWGRVAKHGSGAALFFLPSIGLFLGWPLLAEAGFDVVRDIKVHWSTYVHA